MYDGRRRQTGSAHVRWTTEADEVCLCTIFDVRCTIAELARDLAERMRTGCPGAMIGGGYKGAGADGVCPCTMCDVRWTTEALGSAYVRSTMYDVRLQSSRALRGEAELGRAGCPRAVIGRGYKGAGADGVCLCTIFDVRCTIGKFARVARIFFDAYRR